MPDNVIGKIPEFTQDESAGESQEEVIKSDQGSEGTDTPAELPAENKPADEIVELQSDSEDANARQQTEPSLDQVVKAAVERATVGLRGEIVTLREKLADARTESEKRSLEKQITQAKDDIDELSDLNPDDINVVDRILRSKGYITKQESQSMYYDSVKREEINKFLERYPEYKPENDPSDSRWKALQQEIGLYKMPDDPHFIGKLLERAHRATNKSSLGDQNNTPIKKQQVRTAGVGSGGVQRSSSNKRLSDFQRQQLEQGGWSAEDISNIEKKLT